MKILLFGEFSGFMNCLKNGLNLLGHEVFLVSRGDGYRNYPADFRWDKHPGPNLHRFERDFVKANFWWHRKLLRGYDIVLFINPNNVDLNEKYNKPIYDYIIENNNKIYLSGSGDTKMMFDFWYNSNTKYRHYYEGYLLENPNHPFKTCDHLRKWEEELLSKIDGYIPIWYEYAEPFRKYDCIKNTIRIPIDLNSQPYRPNRLNDGKLLFYHGMTRACKGTRFIKPAFEKMQKYCGDVATFVCTDKLLPFNEYMELVNKTNVIVDDANSYSIAMNGLFSLSKGRLVMGGAEPVANRELGIEGVNPVYNINPDVEQICDVIKQIIDNRENIEELGLKGRKFVEKYHNYIDIAKQYVQLWEKDLNN